MHHTQVSHRFPVVTPGGRYTAVSPLRRLHRPVAAVHPLLTRQRERLVTSPPRDRARTSGASPSCPRRRAGGGSCARTPARRGTYGSRTRQAGRSMKRCTGIRDAHKAPKRRAAGDARASRAEGGERTARTCTHTWCHSSRRSTAGPERRDGRSRGGRRRMRRGRRGHGCAGAGCDESCGAEEGGSRATW